jgi:hypothetical protein
LDIATMDSGARGGEQFRGCVGARESNNLVTIVQKLLHYDRTNKPRRACNEYTHVNAPLARSNYLGLDGEPDLGCAATASQSVMLPVHVDVI